MKAVVLAGGKGTRLRPTTLERPKPLVPVVNKPILDHIIDKLPGKVDEVLLACNFEKKQIEDYYEGKEMEVTVVDEPRPLGTGGAVKNMEPYIDDDFLVFNGDVLSSIDIEKFIRCHEDKGGVGTLSLWSVDNPTRFGIIGTNEEGRIVRFKEKPSSGEVFSNWINAGMYAYTPEIFDYIPSGEKVSMEHEVFPELIEDLFGYKFNGYWIDIGTPSSYLQAHRLLQKQEKGEVIGERIEESAKVIGEVGGLSCLGDDVVVEDGAVVERSVVLENSRIKSDATLKNAIIGSDTVIGRGSEVYGCSVGDDCLIGDGTVLRDGLRLWNKTEVDMSFLTDKEVF